MVRLSEILNKAQSVSGIYQERSFYDSQKARIDALNDTVGNLDELDCTKCNNRGYVYVAGNGGDIVAQECTCMMARRSIRRIEKSGLRSMLERYTFDSYIAADPLTKTAQTKALVYLDEPKGAWFVMSGAAGSGKTHLCVAVCGVLLREGRDVRYMLWRDEIVKLKSLQTETETYTREISKWKCADVLYIDDFLKVGKGGEPSEADINIAFEILNYRYINNQRATLISTERTINEILNLDEALGSRIYERSQNFLIRIEGKGKNKRLDRRYEH